MYPRDRYLETVRGRRADRVPLRLQGLAPATREDLDAMPDTGAREIAGRVFAHRVHFHRRDSHVNRWLVTPPRFIRETDRREDAGALTRTFTIDTPKGPLAAVTASDRLTKTDWTVKYPVESLEDLEKLRSVPWEIPERLVRPGASSLSGDFERHSVLSTRISSPFVCVAGAMAYQHFLELCLTEPDLILEATAECHRRILAVLDVLLSGGEVEYVWIGGCEWLTPPMASPALYEALVQPFEKEIIERVHAAGALAHVHCRGRVRTSLEQVIERVADYFEPVEPPPDGDITMGEAKAVAAGRLTLGGNVEARILANEGPEEAEAATRAAFEGCKERMVLETTVGPVGRVTPQMVTNYHRLIDVWEEVSAL